MKLFFLICFSLLSQSNDGKIYDTGLKLTKPSKHAPKETAQLLFILGDWKIEETMFQDKTKITRLGFSSVSFLNRGHGYLERNTTEIDKKETYEISFFVFGKTTKKWMLGTVSDFTESVEMYDGLFENDQLTLKTAERINGQSDVVFTRLEYTVHSQNKFLIKKYQSIDYGNSWELKRKKVYKRSKKKILPTNLGYGSPIENRTENEKAFDFLIGEGNATMEIQLPSKQWIKFPSYTTAVYALNGKAIYEHNWYDVDTNNPDAASSIIRIYNTNMKRWDCLYTSNRSNTLLYFGGNKEDEDVVLYNFNTNANQPFSQYVFYDLAEKGHYKWHAQQSSDKGKTYNKTFKITVDLK